MVSHEWFAAVSPGGIPLLGGSHVLACDVLLASAVVWLTPSYKGVNWRRD